MGLFSHQMRYVVGDGSGISFGHNLWCGDSTLRDTLPAICRIAHEQGASVAELVESRVVLLSRMLTSSGWPMIGKSLIFLTYCTLWVSEMKMLLRYCGLPLGKENSPYVHFMRSSPDKMKILFLEGRFGGLRCLKRLASLNGKPP